MVWRQICQVIQGHVLNPSPSHLTSGTFFDDWGLLLIVGIVGLALIFWLLTPKKKRIPKQISPEKVDELVAILGGIANIQTLNLDGSRLRFTLENIKDCDFNLLKKYGALGIFVAGKQVKFILRDAPYDLAEAINQRIKER